MADKTPMTDSQKSIVNSAVLKAAMAGVPGSFAMHSDMPFLVGLWVKMIVDLSLDADFDMSTEAALKVASAFATTSASVLIAVRLGTKVFAWTPPGTLAAVATNSLANAACTFIIGDKIAKIYRTIGYTDREAAWNIVKDVGWTLGHTPTGSEFQELANILVPISFWDVLDFLDFLKESLGLFGGTVWDALASAPELLPSMR